VPAEVPVRRAEAPESVVSVGSTVPLLQAADLLGTPLHAAGSVPVSDATGQYRGFHLYERHLAHGGVLAFPGSATAPSSSWTACPQEP
jgi:beta-galactosidase